MPFPEPLGGNAASFAARATCLLIMLLVGPAMSVADEPIVSAFG